MTTKTTTTKKPPEETQETAVAVRQIDPKSVMRYEPTTMDQAWKLAQTLSSSELVPKHYRGKPQDALIVMMRGAELGLTTMRSLELLYPIHGRIGMTADLIVGEVLRSGVCEYFDLVHLDDKKATYVTKRKGASREVEMSYTIEQARTAGLLNKDNWIKNPSDMLSARCATKLCRAAYRDVVAGMHTRDELESGTAEIEAEIASEEAPETLVDRTKAAADIYRGKKRSKKAAKKEPERPTEEEATEIIEEIMPPDEDEIVDAEEVEEEVPEESSRWEEHEAPDADDKPSEAAEQETVTEEDPEEQSETDSEPEPDEKPAAAGTINDDQIIELAQMCKRFKRKFNHVCEFAEEQYGVSSIDDLPAAEFDKFVDAYEDFVSEEEKAKK